MITDGQLSTRLLREYGFLFHAIRVYWPVSLPKKNWVRRGSRFTQMSARVPKFRRSRSSVADVAALT